MGRYDRNMNMLSKEENEKLKDFRVCVLGCGGLGGYAIEMLGRLGIGYITAVDKDVFEETNLNRQILSDMNSLGKSKALMAVERMKLVNPEVFVNAIVDEFNFENGKDIIKGHDIVIDALDNIEGKLTLQDICEELGIPFVHGAIAGWYGQVTTVFPGDKTLKFLYKKEMRKGIEKELGNPSFTPALVASIQVSEALKVLIGRGEVLRRKVLFINTFEQEYEIIVL
ncbi:HesA/MoeB/ThiF family protein [Thermoanaerobacter sp. CM-CNRG TB177]|jgi:molybdopterin/thiamine biosynthesis adenylyltransferase|uniref:UBA/THIF-type NAD/FAD binding protein n=3 Tax=Thermoanaerobacteraceae TaxID=186814 RepID=B0K8P6_THEP3|nr:MULTISPECIES: HesA/MoeB/ThiF family protein [Thermoanaerobacteraceae]KUJ89773.1 MAG: UBA/THIF-type NAD/FAD binding protein [Thermoanaerobacter thermocopriae]MDK2907312.1 molybdopterin-synthase adenylyltransferase [Petrotoga sp.]ABY92673.1 UBA/THIF-type NAD/FAD binding protein [Thermoanaerobacter sp. X514]ABY94509.1 UBA/THIF-type NAD/FAD binding protein [Thermoanaerobacter pseudethanolicus ATCC 33223]ADV79460.1 UBA/THIF-type NAD/FAD binding protein [Thermoanaerobacter brockii subsp. finnii A